MTELQYGLIGLGVTAVAGVLVYNKWQENRHRKMAEAVLQPHHNDVLLAEPGRPAASAPRQEPGLGEPDEFAELRQEPVWSDAPAVEAADVPAFAPAAAPEPEFASAAMPAAAAPSPAAAAEAPLASVSASEVPATLLDPRLEFVVAMELVEPVPAAQILQAQRESLARLHKPVHWLGFNERTREWVRLGSDSELPVRSLRIGLQLVNRMGPVGEGDLAIFATAIEALADDLMAVADMPPTNILDQAAEIDRFCAAVDLEIGLNLVSRGLPFPGTKIRALAEAAGMALSAEGVFTRFDDSGRAQFSLQNYESTPFSADTLRALSTHGLTFLLDVPRVDHGEQVFLQMTELARRFAETLQGSLVDDNRQPLGEVQLEHIRREFIGKPQATMASYGLPAGSPQALRLFS